MELEAQKHQVLIYTIVIDLVPMQVEHVEKGLKPKLLPADSILFVGLAYLSKELCYPLGKVVLIWSFVRVPER